MTKNDNQTLKDTAEANISEGVSCAAAAGYVSHRPNWPVMIQGYVQQMGTTDNAVKIEVLEHLNNQIATCLERWRKDHDDALASRTWNAPHTATLSHEEGGK